MARISIAEIESICAADLAWVAMLGLTVEDIGEGTARVRLPYDRRWLRPGGTINGPALMSLADFAMYVAVLSAIGRVELAVTTNLTCNFLRRPRDADVIAAARLIKLGKHLAYGEVSMYCEGEPEGESVAHVTATYSIPPPQAREGGMQ